MPRYRFVLCTTCVHASMLLLFNLLSCSLFSTNQTCDATNENALITWTPINATGSFGLLGLWSSSGALCLGIWGVFAHTGAPSVSTVPCNSSDMTQVWQFAQNATLYNAPFNVEHDVIPRYPKWRGLSASRLVNVGSGQCLEFPGQQGSVGLRVETWACHSAPPVPDGNQLWFFNPLPLGTNGSVLQSVISGLCVGLCPS